MSDAPASGAAGRMVALDAFRGATVAAMLLVNNPGSWSHVYAPLRHAEWHGWTPTDLIFPFFLFIVGLTTHLAIERRLDAGADAREMTVKVVRRGLLIVTLGLVLNAFPFVSLGPIPGFDAPSVGERIVRQVETLRIPGVLQRIGVVYLALGMWALRRRGVRRPAFRVGLDTALVTVVLMGYWALLTLARVPGSGARGIDVLGAPGETITAWSDRAVFGIAHLWSQSKTWDPEGVFSTIPAFATALLGLMTGRLISSQRPTEKKAKNVLIAGACLTIVGLLWGERFPINKNLWTSSYVVFTAGAAMLCLAACIWVIDVRGWKRIAVPAVAFGINPMLAFFASGIMARLITSVIRLEVDGRRVPLQRAIYEPLFASWMPDNVASLVWATSFVLLWLGILWPLWKREIIWKV